VIAVCRYLTDTSFANFLSDINHVSSSSDKNPPLKDAIMCSGSSMGDHIDTDIYDMVLTNGKFATKCLLMPACNYLIKTNKVISCVICGSV
jgi:hypothetical protein